jgi:hypothetical protein
MIMIIMIMISRRCIKGIFIRVLKSVGNAVSSTGRGGGNLPRIEKKTDGGSQM